MRDLLFILAIILVTLWSIAFIGYNIGGRIHVLLPLVVIIIVVRIILEGKSLAKPGRH